MNVPNKKKKVNRANGQDIELIIKLQSTEYFLKIAINLCFSYLCIFLK